MDLFLARPVLVVATVEEAHSTKQSALTLLLNVKAAYDRTNERQLLFRMIEVDIAGKLAC